MNAAILMSIKPKWVEKILNGEKTIEIRKRFPKDYVGWVYIYCTKDKTTTINLETLLFGNPKNAIRNGKVVARFWCDKVEEINKVPLVVIGNYLKNACLSVEELQDYSRNYKYKTYAIHITKLEIFDKPKEISELHKIGYNDYCDMFNESPHILVPHFEDYKIIKAPQSWCYVEVVR